MDSNGGMVAVVQGLKDAGLAVTLLSPRYSPPGRSVLAELVGSTSPTQACQTVADSATETIPDRPKDTLYRSSYQMAHCQPLGCSSVRFPQYSFQGFHEYRSSTSRSPDEEAFVGSLRKYPISPVRSRSADLIERMLSYTQSKNGARHSKTRSAKSLPSKEAAKQLHLDEIPTRDTGIAPADLRPNFGYKRDVELIPVPTSSRRSRYDHQSGMYDYLKSNHKEKKLKGSEVRYLTNVKQCLRERLRQICDEEPPAICPKIQHRYSQHRRQYHRAENSQKMQKVNYCKNLEKCTDCKENEIEDSSKNEIRISPSTSREHKESKVNRSLSTFKHSKACFCNRPGPCNCGTQPSRSTLKPRIPDENLVSDSNRNKQCISTCEYDCNKSKELYTRQLKEIVLNWSQELPLYANFNSNDAMKREEIINNLIDTLGQMHKDNMSIDKIEDEIKKIIKVLPMWRPENKADQESFENQLVFSLVKKITSVINDKNDIKDEITKWIEKIPFTNNTINKEQIINDLVIRLKPITLRRPHSDKDYKDALKFEIVNKLNDLPIDFTGSKTTFVNNIADNLVEKLQALPLEKPSLPEHSDIKSLILDWIKDIPQVFEDIHLNSDDYQLVNDLITTLHNIHNTDVDNKHERINDAVTNWLNFVEEKKKLQIHHDTKNMLIRQLLNKLINLNSVRPPREIINDVIQKWFDDMPHTLGVNFMDNQKDLEILTEILQDVQNIENEENRENTMRQEILKWLQNLQRKQGQYVDAGVQENLVNKLMSMIKDKLNAQKRVSENGFITQNILKWLESQPEFKQDNAMQYRDLVIELSKKLQDIKDKEGELTEHDIKTELTNWFEKLSQERGIQIEPINQKKLQDKLLSSIGPIKKRRNWEKPRNIQELISKEVSDVINNSIIYLKEDDKKRLMDQITEVITQDWNAIHSLQTNEPLSKVINLLKQTTNLPETQINKMAQTLFEKVKNITLSNLSDVIPEGPLILDNTSKDILKSKVEDIVKTLPLKDKQQVINTITDTLVKNYEDVVASDNGFEEICKVLKNANINESEAREVTNKILEMSNQFKSEATDTTYKSPTYGSAESLWMQKQMFMQRLEREITDFMEKVLNESSSFYKDTTSRGVMNSEPVEYSTNYYNKFKTSPLKTSTPTKFGSGEVLDIEKQYTNQIKEIIKKWIENVEIDIIDECFKDNMAHDIATDIIDRQRYIQHSKIKRKSHDEMEHLKYQLFKWISKLPNPIDLHTKTEEIKMLMKSLEVLEIPSLISKTNKRLGVSNEDAHSKFTTETNGNILIQDTNEFIEENIFGAIWNWLNEILSLKPRTSNDKRMMDDHITELSKKLNNILRSDPDTGVQNMEKLCKNEIVHYLKKMNRHIESNEVLLEHRASELINYLNDLEFFAAISKQNQQTSREVANRAQKQDAIKQAVRSWCQRLPLKTGKTHDDMKDIVENLAEAVSRYLLITDMENINTFMEDILNNLKKLPLQFDKEDSTRLPEFTERLIEKLKGVLSDSEKYYSGTQDEFTVQKPPYRKAAQVMYDNIHKWCENLPLALGIVNESNEQINMFKQNIAAKLLKKVGELNLDPEIFHDDYLYEDVLKDEIEKILDNLPKTTEFENVLPSLKENLIKDLLQAKEGMKNEIAGFAYKQQLRDAISKTLSSIGLTISEETPFEVLKDNLADAFISLHYIMDDEELKRKFKDKIFNEVNRFCDDYLKRNPSTPLNANQLNQELYKALKKVPVPKEESMRREVEQIRIKDIVTDWFKDLTLEETPSHVQQNKIISILAKRLHEIENEAEINTDIDIDEIMDNEISKWLKKFKVKFENELSIQTAKKKLIDKLKTTKPSRKFNESTIRKSINYIDLTSDLEDSRYYPPSNLSADDRAHLQRIKDRISADKTFSKPDDKKDASVSPVPIATGMQTEEKRVPDNYIFQKISQNASIQTIVHESEQPTTMTPQVIVKEYYWDSHGSPTMQRSGSILSCMQPPVTQLTGSVQQKVHVTPQGNAHVTTASQTIPLPASKGTITQEASIGQTHTTRKQNDSIGTTAKLSCLTRATQAKQLPSEIMESQPGRYEQDDYLQLNAKKKPEIKSCQPCRGRAVLTGDLHETPEAGTSKAFQQSCSDRLGQATDNKPNIHKTPEYLSTGHINEDGNYLDNPEDLSPPCFRRSIYQTPTKDIECIPKRKRRNQPCACKNPILTKCTIRPQSPCQHSTHSNKSCYVAKKHCPKCWDGFCPHPSYLYFRQD